MGGTGPWDRARPEISEDVPPPTPALPRTGGGRRNPLSRNGLLRFQGRGGTPGVLDGRERRGCWEHAPASGGWGLVVETPGRRPRLRGLDDQTPATPRDVDARIGFVRCRHFRHRPQDLRLELASLAHRVRFAWRTRWLGKSPLTGRAPLSCNHERSGGWGLVFETPGRRPRLRGHDDQTPATPRDVDARIGFARCRHIDHRSQDLHLGIGFARRRSEVRLAPPLARKIIAHRQSPTFMQP